MSIFGTGDAIVETLNPIASLGNKTKMQDLCFLNIATSSQPSEVKSQCRDPKSGLLVTKRKAITEVVHTVTITANHYDWQSLGFFHDELPQDAATSMNVNKRVQIPAGITAPFVITDADIVTANMGSVGVYVTESGGWGDARTLICTAPGVAPADGTEFQLDDTANTLTFHQDLAGASILYKFDQAYTAIQTIGVNPVWEAYGDMELYASLFGTGDFPAGLRLHFPELVRSSAPPQIDLSQSPATVTITFEANSVDGRPYPYRLLNPAYATP